MSGKRVKEAWENGNVDMAPMMMGQSVGLVHDVPTCKELIDRMVKEAKEHIAKASEKMK
jgi:nitronate monooxygenase